jgi:hypothetical protein
LPADLTLWQRNKRKMRNLKTVEWVETKNGCWECTSHYRDQQGYPIIYRYGIYKRAHRWIYEECFGFMPEGIVVRHLCNNPSCINPEHLNRGTIKDNTHDMIRSGRMATKLSWKDVKEIRQSKGRGVDLATTYKVSPALICKVRRETCWKRGLHERLEREKEAYPRFNALAEKQTRKKDEI